jgi:hypothetical protein
MRNSALLLGSAGAQPDSDHFQDDGSKRERAPQFATVRFSLRAQGSACSNAQQRATVRERGARERSLTLTTSKMMGAQKSTRTNAQQRATVRVRGSAA